MAELDYILREKYRDYFATLKSTSYDKENDTYLCQSQKRVINFDKLTEGEADTLKTPRSFDALLYDAEQRKVFCVEFKNQEKSTINNRIIQKKMIEGREALDRILTENSIQRKEYTFIFCVACKANDKHYRYRNKIEENSLHFNLEKYSGVFDHIVTNDIAFFTDEFRKKYSCSHSGEQ